MEEDMSPFVSRNLKKVLSGVVLAGFLVTPVEAGYLYHAGRRSVLGAIAKKGINPAKFRGKARFGKGFYTGKRPSTAIAEKGPKSSVLRLKESAALKKTKPMDVRKPTASNLREHLGPGYDLRGAYKGTTIGPKAGKKLGRIAGDQNRSVWYRSKVNGGTNVFYPKKLIERYPRGLKTDRIMPFKK
jgi:hypothetical protein